LGDPAVLGDPARVRETAKERAQLEPLVDAFRDLKRVREEVRGNEALLADDDPEMREMAKQELPSLRARLAQLEGEVKILLLPKDRNDARDVILEIGAGAGGDEAGLFAGEILGMYVSYEKRRGWTASVVDSCENSASVIKVVTDMISDGGVFSCHKYACCAPRCTRWNWRRRRRRATRRAGDRSAPATAARRSGRTTSRRIV